MSVIDDEAVRPCLETAFRAGELVRHSTVVVEYTDGFNPGPGVELRLETSAGDVQSFPVWQPGVPSLATGAGMRRNLLRLLEDWLPESRLRWGEEVRFDELHGAGDGADSEG
ncbi:hypothetical protein ABH926_006398 [Catenulispora sp. GP43]|uniref:hypothetical protein n=1 Tax=Catenulispora sp. GP43 TaxID=3156263 RepID=UPI003514E8CF